MSTSPKYEELATPHEELATPPPTLALPGAAPVPSSGSLPPVPSHDDRDQEREDQENDDARLAEKAQGDKDTLKKTLEGMTEEQRDMIVAAAIQNHVNGKQGLFDDYVRKQAEMEKAKDLLSYQIEHFDSGTEKPPSFGWVNALHDVKKWRSWEFVFITNAKLQLTKNYIKTEAGRDMAWVAALLKAAELGHNTKMRNDIERLSLRGEKGSKIFYELKAMYCETTEVEKKTHMEHLKNFVRKPRETLKDLLQRLDILLMECENVGYQADDETKMMVLNCVMYTNEMVAVTLAMPHDMRSFKHTRAKAIDLAEIYDSSRHRAPTQDTYAQFTRKPHNSYDPNKDTRPYGARASEDERQVQAIDKACRTHDNKPTSRTGPLNPQNKDPNMHPTVKCFNCQSFGHYAGDCPKPQRARPDQASASGTQPQGAAGTGGRQGGWTSTGDGWGASGDKSGDNSNGWNKKGKYREIAHRDMGDEIRSPTASNADHMDAQQIIVDNQLVSDIKKLPKKEIVKWLSPVVFPPLPSAPVAKVTLPLTKPKSAMKEFGKTLFAV
jgi:hypothetical protein